MAKRRERNGCYDCCSTHCAFCMPLCIKCCPCCCLPSEATHPKILYGSLNQQDDEADGMSEADSTDLPSVIPVTKIFQFPHSFQDLPPRPQIGDDEHKFKRPVIADQPRVVKGMSMNLQKDGFSFDPGDIDEDVGEDVGDDEYDEEEEDDDEEEDDEEDYADEEEEDEDQYTSGMSVRESSNSSKLYADDDFVSSDDSYSEAASLPVKGRGTLNFGRIERTPEHTLERSTMKPAIIRSSQVVHASMFRNVLEEISQRHQDSQILPEVAEFPAVHLALYYDRKNKCITVHISKAVNLCTSFPVSNSNPFVIAYLLPSKSNVQQSPSIRETHNPLFNYVFKFFGMDDDSIKHQVLVVKLYINDINHFIGGVVLELESADLFGTAIVKELCQFDEHCSTKESYQGDILVSLCYQSESRVLSVRILEACNLRKNGTPGIPNPYIKVNLLYNGERIFKLKTTRSKERRTVNPVINDHCEVRLATMDTDSVQIDILVMSYDRFSHNELIGAVNIGSQVQQISGKIHWKEIMKDQNQPVTRWHAIYNTSTPSHQTTSSITKRLYQVSGMQI